MGVLKSVITYGRMIKFSHSVFALPFALCAALLAAIPHGVGMRQVGYIVLAMMAARSAAMGFNRLADRETDAVNPRTRHRELPRGTVTPAAVAAFVVVSSVVLIFAAWQLNRLCFYLSPLVLAILFAYSLTKRFTWASHLVLGLCLGGAPLGAWIAITGTVDIVPVILGLAVLAWVAGFDVIYSCQDRDFDERAGLYSIPVRYGVRTALNIARLLHVTAVGFLLLLANFVDAHLLYVLGVGVVAALLVYEHRLVRADDLSRLDMAFFTMNGIISVVYFGFTLADLWLLGEGIVLLRP